MKRNLLALLTLVALIALSGCETSNDSRVSDEESTKVLNRYETYGILGDQISSASHKKPKQGFATEATLIVVVN